MHDGNSQNGKTHDSGNALVNESIRFTEMRVVDPEGVMLGVISKAEALAKAKEWGLDLVCVSPNTSPVVCKIMDYGKHLYKMKKKAKRAKKNQVTVEIKELKIRPNTDTHDIETKIRQAKKFLAEGNKVKFTVFFRGREVMFADKVAEDLKKIAEALGGSDALQIEMDGVVKQRRMIMMLTPKN